MWLNVWIQDFSYFEQCVGQNKRENIDLGKITGIGGGFFFKHTGKLQ